MILIAHRGNIDGPNPKLENKPSYIQRAIELGFDVEIDVWYRNGWYLGHDKPQYKIDPQWLLDNNVYHSWIHCKNLEALYRLEYDDIGYFSINYFWHQNDDYTLTSKKFIWAYPNKPIKKGCIAVMPEISKYAQSDLKKCYGICTDYPERYIHLRK